MSEFGLLSNFSDTRATSHLLVLPASTSGHIYDVIGTPPERKGGVN